MEKYGIVDIGSNTVRLEVYILTKEKELVRLFKKKESLGLSSYIENKIISEKGIRRLINILKEFKQIAQGVRVKDLYMFATAAIRNSNNAYEVIYRINEEVGVSVDLISGEKEAELGFLAVTDKFGIDSGLNIDIGGGSTEVILFEDGDYQISKSLEEGSLSLFTKHVEEILPNWEEAEEIKKSLQDQIKKQGLLHIKRDKLTAVGGTVRVLNRLIRDLNDYDEEIDHFSVNDLKEVVEGLLSRDKYTIRTLLQLSPDRIHTITPGAIILKEICKYYSVEKVLVSQSGVRTGYLLRKLNRQGVLWLNQLCKTGSFPG